MPKLVIARLLGVIIFLTMIPAAIADSLSEGEQSLRETAAIHIKAIEERDLDSLLATITKGEELTLIFPNGTTLKTRQEYIDFHITWFSDKSWTMEIEPISYTVRKNFAVVLVKTTYTDAAGPRQAMLALSFALENDSWRLIFDQNTRIVSD